MNKTKVNKDEVKDLLNSYKIGNYKSHMLFKGGAVHSIYKLQTSKGIFVLKVYEERTVKQIDSEITLLRRIKNVPIQKPIKSTSSYRHKIANKQCVIYTYLEGTHKEKVNEKHLFELGVYVARIHKSTEKLILKGLEKKHIYGKRWVRELLAELEEMHNHFPKNKVQYADKLLRTLNTPSLRKGIIHADIHKENILFLHNKLNGIIDFDDCNYSNLILDLGCIIGYICVGKKEGIQTNLLKSFIQGYESERTLLKREKESLYDYTILFMLIHYCYYNYDKNNWNKETPASIRIKHLLQLGKERFQNLIK